MTLRSPYFGIMVLITLQIDIDEQKSMPSYRTDILLKLIVAQLITKFFLLF
jgi:hypothetical protein